MKIVSFKICPFVQRVTALLEAKGATYEIEYIHLSAKPQWFLEAAPNGQVPILITDSNEVIFESDAISEYIEELVPEPLFPRDPVAKAQQRAWSYLASKNYLVQCSAQRSPSQEVLQERADKLRTAFAKLDKRLDDSSYFNGLPANNINMVDIACLPLLHRAAIIEKHTQYDFLAGFANLKILQKNILATELPRKSVSADFEEKFSAFYLSEDTYLGQIVRTR
ncbi:MAG: glutathione S-transferase family protein [Spirochaetota bacterium]